MGEIEKAKVSKIDDQFVTSLFIAFGSASNADDFCKHLIHKALRSHQAAGAIIGVVGNDSKCRLIGKYGAWRIPPGATISIWDDSPIADAINSYSRVALKKDSEMAAKYPESDIHLEGAKSYLFSPFDQKSKAIGFIGLGFMEASAVEHLENFELTLTTLAAEFIASTSRPSVNLDGLPYNHKKAGQDGLTSREIGVLRLLSENLTNYQIGRQLNLAESTIKQETVRIFRKLAVTNRKEAAEKARVIGLL